MDTIYALWCRILFCLLCVGIWSQIALAGELRQIVLKDGSVIKAEVISLKNGIYTLRSSTLGELQIKDSQIQIIETPQLHDGRDADIDVRQQQISQPEDIDTIQKSVLNNPGLLSMVFALQEDPEVQQILQDPEIMGLISSGNIKALEAHPKFIKLMENSKIKAIVEQFSN